MANDVESGKVCAILSYLLVGIIWYFADENMKKNNFVKFHVKQGLVLIIISIAGSIVLSMLFFIGWFIFPIWQLAILILAILGIINAVNGKEKELPNIGQFAKHLTF